MTTQSTRQIVAHAKMLAVAEVMLETRKTQGFKQVWVAGQIGVTPTVLSRLEHGHRPWSLALLFEACEVLDVNLRDVVDLAEKRVEAARDGD